MKTSDTDQGFLCILGGQRTGTTVMRSILSSSGAFKDHGEIFHLENLTEGSFVRFVEEKGLGFNSWSRDLDAIAVADMYFSFLLSKSDLPVHIIDVKLNSWNAFQPVWRYASDPPFLLEYIIKHDVPIIFTARKNILDQVLSEEIAKKIGKWHNSESKDIDEKFVIPPGRVITQLKKILLTERLLFEHLKSYGNFHIAIYEDTLKENTISDDLVQFVQGLLGRHVDLPESKVIFKNQIEKSRVIKNYNELKKMADEKISEIGRFFTDTR